MSPSGLRQDIGQVVFLGFAGTTVPAELRSLVREFRVGGIVLFKRNVESPGQVAELSFELSRLLADTPLWVAVDQEGGRVARMRAPFTEWPALAALGRADDERLARRFARALAAEMRAVGVTFDFAPVMDVLTRSDNPAIGDRAIAATPDAVARLGAAIIAEMQAAGIAACAKHFPGHGDTGVDSHHALPLVEHSPDRLRAVEYVPFRAAVDADVAGVMVAHLLVPALDDAVPASLSRRVVTDELRKGLRFENLILTDDLGMKGCADAFPPPVASVKALSAGHDAVLLCDPQPDVQFAALEAIVRAVEDGTIPHRQAQDSVDRHRRLKARYVPAGDATRRPSEDWRTVVGCAEHQAVAEDMRQFA